MPTSAGSSLDIAQRGVRRGTWTLRAVSLGAERATPSDAPDTKIAVVPEPTESPRYLHDEQQTTSGSVTVAGRPIAYQAEAGILVVHVKDPWMTIRRRCATRRADRRRRSRRRRACPMWRISAATRRMAIVPSPFSTTAVRVHRRSGCTWAPSVRSAWSRRTIRTVPRRRIGSSTMNTRLLDASDLVFIDAPGTGFGHLRGTDKEKAFYGVDQDAHAFANFIVEFLSRHNRWNSPKYLFGESYGTTRSAALANILRERKVAGFERRDSAVADAEFRRQRRCAAVQSGRRSALCAGVADLRRDRVVSPQAAESAGRARAVAAGGGEVRA